MTFSIAYHKTGHGVESSLRGYYEWWGHSFNPTSDTNLGANTWDYWNNTDWTYDPETNVHSAYTETTSFDLTGMQQGQELVMQVIRIRSTPSGDSGTVVINFKDPDGNTLYTSSYSISSSSGYTYWEWWFWMGIGIKANSGQEIWKNGTYSATVTVGGVSSTINFTVSNYPTATACNYPGNIWVEGNNLCFSSYQGCWKIKCLTDGTNYGSIGTGYAGAAWLETDGKIAYVDEYGDKRMTKMGDRYGYGGWSSEIPSGPGMAYAGSIWVSDDNNDTYLMIVSNNGYKYRIGAGYAGVGDYQ